MKDGQKSEEKQGERKKEAGRKEEKERERERKTRVILELARFPGRRKPREGRNHNLTKGVGQQTNKRSEKNFSFLTAW